MWIDWEREISDPNPFSEIHNKNANWKQLPHIHLFNSNSTNSTEFKPSSLNHTNVANSVVPLELFAADF